MTSEMLEDPQYEVKEIKSELRYAKQVERPWHTLITLDLIVSSLNRSLFHPFVAWMIPLCLRAMAIPYEASSMQVAAVYASVITVWYFLDAVNWRIAYGPPRDVDFEEEVIVITGGARGLGLAIAEMYGMKGASVAVLDVNDMPERENAGIEGVNFYKCDVTKRQDVDGAKAVIEKELGTPTILINCAASSFSGEPLISMSAAEIDRTIATNLTSQFTILQAFLPGLISSPSGGTIVTVSSVLGYIGTANLSAYCATKAALISMHHSLMAELRQYPKIKTILVTPGQIRTSMFDGVATPSNFLAPILEPIDLAKEVVSMIDQGNGGQISMPVYARLIAWGAWASLPAAIQRLVSRAGGIDEAVQRRAPPIPSRRVA